MTLHWFLLLPLLLSACATTAPVLPEVMPHLVWPAAPEPARIEFVNLFSKADDLGMKKSFFSKLIEFFAGAEERRMTRPYAIAANSEKIIVADPDASAVHLFDLKRKKYRKLNRTGNLHLETPIGVAISDDRLFIADSQLNKVFILDEKLELLTVLQGFQRPTGLAFDPVRQYLYIADTLAHQVKVFDHNGQFQFIIGEHGENNAQFNFPTHLAFSGDRLFVNDTMNFRIQIFEFDGRHLKTFGKHGDASGSFAQSKGLAIDADGHVYVADAMSGRVQIFDQNGVFLLDFGSFGNTPGSFQLPAGLSFWEDKLYVADSFNGRVQVFRYLAVEN
ncbi:MAG: 6-bladed beta-propeller [Gammaproteobacteria bacterium]|jgi:DNA-binding beta-propeller fold protein YncE|nr:6-bladed beta-propeller [Gammaproteobacteria bacterium]MBT7579661.1 6-bladed beta-propeller [Candidatus Neomarinimicrobiota bacterium]MBT3724526.1 6-bladed beta-propeller [Gammaproteobacteria bacterium]MBT4076391.1 6-bladed beta-propeller [Gammaproteobacteria bacterium]MBT4193185.1 6-bladed beta-propeller [Gammaproteobacteria bacterium]